MQRKNVNLIGVFTEKVRRIGESASKYHLELQEYERMLGVKPKNRRNSSKNSFYMTN